MNHRSDVWVLCGIALGLLLLFARWWDLRAEGAELESQVQQIQADVEELEPVVREVKGLKARRESLESLISGLVERHKLCQLAAGALSSPEPGVALERLEVHGLEVEIVARAADERAVQGWIDALEEGGGFRRLDGDDAALGDASDPARFVVRGELGSMTEEAVP